MTAVREGILTLGLFIEKKKRPMKFFVNWRSKSMAAAHVTCFRFYVCHLRAEEEEKVERREWLSLSAVRMHLFLSISFSV
jgi:hypothetical protein